MPETAIILPGAGTGDIQGAYMNTLVSASILSADFGYLADEIKKAEQAGCHMIHFDVMDGHFVPNISYGIPVLKSVRRYTRLPMDVHLMIERPEEYVARFRQAGADIITFHLEASKDPVGLAGLIKETGARAGISVKPGTPVETVYPYIGLVDMVLVMTVEPGFGGQGFISSTTAKIKALRDYCISHGRALDIEVDGGITDSTAPIVRDAGANVLVSGSYLFKAEDMRSRVLGLIG